MTQEAIALRTTGDSYPGVAVVQDINKALATIATDFAGIGDPAAIAGPYMTWADTSNGLLRRRNAANTSWDIVGPLSSYGSAAMTFPVAPSGDPTHAVAQSQVIGIAQAIQEVTRTLGATNVNTTGKPIIAYMEGTSNAANASMTIVVNGRQVVLSYAPTAIGGALGVNAIIPAGANYIYGATGFSSIAIGEYR